MPSESLIIIQFVLYLLSRQSSGLKRLSDHPKALFEESKMDNFEEHFEAMETGRESEYVTEDVTEITDEAFESNPEVRTINCAI